MHLAVFAVLAGLQRGARGRQLPKVEVGRQPRHRVGVGVVALRVVVPQPRLGEKALLLARQRLCRLWRKGFGRTLTLRAAAFLVVGPQQRIC